LNGYQYDGAGLALTESEEGLRLTAYQDVRGVWTVGWGHTGPDVHEGLTITQGQAEALLRADIAHAVATVNRFVKVPLTQTEFDALVDFTYNAGCGAFEGSTMLKDLNAGDYAAAADQFEVWDKAGGETVADLLRRREAEERLFANGALVTD
jgi:lysozyme